MKAFLRGILTIFVTILLIIFGLVNSMRAILIGTTDKMVKKEIKTNVVKIIEDSVGDDVRDDVINKVEKEIDNNPNVGKLIDNYYDKILDALTSDSASIEIDAVKEIENLLDDSEEILKDYGVVLTEEEKDELLSTVSSSEINTIVNDAISNVKSNMSSDMKNILDVYAFLMSQTFKVILVGLVVVSLILIALLKKSFYGWLSNFGVASIIAGVVVGIVLPLIVSGLVSSIASSENLEFSTSTLNTYGYILIILGIIAIIGKIVITKIEIGKKDTDQTSTEESC